MSQWAMRIDTRDSFKIDTPFNLEIWAESVDYSDLQGRREWTQSSLLADLVSPDALNCCANERRSWPPISHAQDVAKSLGNMLPLSSLTNGSLQSTTNSDSSTGTTEGT